MPAGPPAKAKGAKDKKPLADGAAGIDMHTTGGNSVCRRRAATTGLLLILMASAAGADPLVADAAIDAASRQLLAGVAAIEGDVSASPSSVDSSSVSAAQTRASTGDDPVGPVDDDGAFLGQLVARYFESYD